MKGSIDTFTAALGSAALACALVMSGTAAD